MIREVGRLVTGDRVHIGDAWYKVTHIRPALINKVRIELEPLDDHIPEDGKRRIKTAILTKELTLEVRGTASDQLRESWGLQE